MKKYSYLLFLSILFTLSSCLTGGLEDLPEFEENEISGVQRVEYRYISDEVSNASGQQIVKKSNLDDLILLLIRRLVQLVWMYQFLLPMKDLFRRQSGRNVQ